MRPLPVLFSTLLLLEVLASCHKSSQSKSRPEGSEDLAGDWKMVQLSGGLAIDVVPLDKDHEYHLQFFTDSSIQYTQIFNGKKYVSKGTFITRLRGTAPSQERVMYFGDSTGKLYDTSYYVQTGRLINNQIVITMPPDPAYKAVYARQ